MKCIKIILSVLFLSFLTQGFAEETPWDVPQEKSDKTAPTMFNEQSVKAGEEIYMKNCKSCHGDIGKANMIPLDPLPKDLSIGQVVDQTNGDLYYKISQGRGAMPSFKNVLSLNDIWNVVAYIRSYHKDYIQPVPTAASQFSGEAVTLSLEWLDHDKKLKLTALGKKDDKDVPAEGVEVALYAKRYFGQLKIGDNKSTNAKGEIIFEIPTKLPGDTLGNIELTAKIIDIDKYGEAIVTQKFIAGEPTNKPSLTEKRAMWNVVSKAPMWLTITYPLVVLGVMGIIGYIMLLLRKVYIIGKKEDEKES